MDHNPRSAAAPLDAGGLNMQEYTGQIPLPRIVGKLKENISLLQDLILNLSAGLTDEGSPWSDTGLHELRRRVANALPPDKRPDWLHSYADPAMTTGLALARRDEGGEGHE